MSELELQGDRRLAQRARDIGIDRLRPRQVLLDLARADGRRTWIQVQESYHQSMLGFEEFVDIRFERHLQKCVISPDAIVELFVLREVGDLEAQFSQIFQFYRAAVGKPILVSTKRRGDRLGCFSSLVLGDRFTGGSVCGPVTEFIVLEPIRDELLREVERVLSVLNLTRRNLLQNWDVCPVQPLALGFQLYGAQSL